LDALHGSVAFKGGGGKAVVVPPVHDRGADGQAGGDEGVQLVVGDGQHLDAETGEHLIGQGQRKAGSAGNGADGNVGIHAVLLSKTNKNKTKNKQESKSVAVFSNYSYDTC